MKNDTVPQHIAVICDGNRRWARSHGFEVFTGHQKAVNEVFETIIDHAANRGVQYLTFWIFSTHNWKRDKKEVDFLMKLFRDFFDTKIDSLDQKGVKLNMIGDITGFEQDIQDRIIKGKEKTKSNNRITVTLAMNYGGRDELTRAFKKIAQKIQTGELKPEDITEDIISNHLDTAGIPDPDLIIRTSGENRMSGFLSWQHEYAEFFFPEYHFPELTPEKFDEAIEEFNDRQRRFGGG